MRTFIRSNIRILLKIRTSAFYPQTVMLASTVLIRYD